MPYTHKKVGTKYVVYKKGKKVGETQGTKIALDKYLAALHIADKKSAKKESKSLKESIMEPYTDDFQHPGCEDKIGHIFVVLKPTPEMPIDNMVHKTHAFGVNQFEPSTVHGVYGDENEANLVAEATTRDLHKHLRKVEEKKDLVINKLDKHINRLQKEVNHHMKHAGLIPEETDHHHMMAEKKMAMMKNLRAKHQLVKAAKKELPKKDEE
jgi:hypothetical protein